MPWRIIGGLVALFVLTNAQNQRLRWEDNRKETPSDNLIDIDLETERNNALDQGGQEFEWVSGSGSGMEDTDDEDLLASGSGSGGGVPHFTDTAEYTTKSITTTTSTTTTPSPLSPCQQLRDASKHLLGNYVPRCNDNGNYDSLQCRGHPGTGTCWCADLGGREIPGTALSPPLTPDCNLGQNLPPCVFKLVQQSRTGLLGAFRPKCTLEGNFESRQCTGSQCYCVDSKSGVKQPGTEVFLPDDPYCDGRPTPDKGVRKNDDKITLHPPHHSTPAPEVDTPKINVNIEGGEGPKDKKKPPVSNESGNEGEPKREPSSAAHVMTQPGILAAIIGGSVVLLLCAILLVMFIVYRMRKKDEGSYALDEPKKMPNYSYQRAPDREFYA